MAGEPRAFEDDRAARQRQRGRRRRCSVHGGGVISGGRNLTPKPGVVASRSHGVQDEARPPGPGPRRSRRCRTRWTAAPRVTLYPTNVPHGSDAGYQNGGWQEHYFEPREALLRSARFLHMRAGLLHPFDNPYPPPPRSVPAVFPVRGSSKACSACLQLPDHPGPPQSFGIASRQDDRAVVASRPHRRGDLQPPVYRRHGVVPAPRFPAAPRMPPEPPGRLPPVVTR